MKKENIHEINMKINGDDWTKALDKAFIKLNKKAKIDGFRPGKAPRHIFEAKYGKEALYDEAIENSYKDAYKKALDESKLIPIIYPKIDLINVDDEGVEFSITITTKPVVKLGKYKNLGITKEEVKVTDEEIEDEINRILDGYAELVIKEEGTLENGNIAIIDFEGFNDGVAFEGGKALNYSLRIGSNMFIPGFEEALIGMKIDEEKDINLTFPLDYMNDDLKGKEVVFKVKLNEIKERVLPDLDENFFMDLDMEGISSRKELHDQIKMDLEAKKENDIENKYYDELLEKASSTVEVDIPEELIDEEIDRMFNQFKENMSMQGITMEQYYEYTKSNEDGIKKSMHKEAEKRVLCRFMLEEIAELEKIEISDDEALEEASNLANKYNMEQDKFLEIFGGIEMVKYDLKMRKAIDILKS